MSLNGHKIQELLYLSLILALFLLSPAGRISAQSLEELKKVIDQKSEEIRKLEAEEKKFLKELLGKQNEKKTLKDELQRINNNIKGLRSEISLTQKKVEKTASEIEALKLEINDKEEKIKRQKDNLSGIMQIFAEEEKKPVITVILENDYISDFFSYLEAITNIKKSILDRITTLKSLRIELALKEAEAESKKDELEDLRQDLQSKRTIEEMEKKKNSEIFKIAENQEKLYQKILEENRKRQEELEKEIEEFERQLQTTFDLESLPKAGSGVLGRPLENISLRSCKDPINLKNLINCITQFFGNTTFARAGGYNGKGHNGMDFRASVGTNVLASEDGIVRGVGDTDTECKKASYGKWALIDHSNNLSSIYAHLALVKVTTGQAVKRGETIGYSGSSGYATGPHLHFGLYAREAVTITELKSRICGRNMTLPLSPTKGYLNPLVYL